MKIGRNNKCPCGSGKKYKKCCLNKNMNDIPKEVLEWALKRKREEMTLKEMGIYINYVTPCKHKGEKLWGIGNIVYRRPSEETFHEFIIFLLIETLGKDWWDKNLNDEDDPHFIMTCYKKYLVWRKTGGKAKALDDGVSIMMANGWVESLLSLAFDIATLRHFSNLPINMLNRLRDKNEYQGVRYEIGVAAIFARLGFSVEFTSIRDKKKHCEFFARKGDTQIAVEAKSRHRSGVLHTKGKINEEKLLHIDVKSYIEEALGQNPKNGPFLIFVDINCPPTPQIEMENKPWFNDIRARMDNFEKEDGVDPWNGIFFTNYSYHYGMDAEVGNGEHLSLVSFNPKYILPLDCLDMLHKALSYYGRVPNFDIEIGF